MLRCADLAQNSSQKSYPQNKKKIAFIWFQYKQIQFIVMISISVAKDYLGQIYWIMIQFNNVIMSVYLFGERDPSSSSLSSLGANVHPQSELGAPSC